MQLRRMEGMQRHSSARVPDIGLMTQMGLWLWVPVCIWYVFEFPPEGKLLLLHNNLWMLRLDFLASWWGLFPNVQIQQ